MYKIAVLGDHDSIYGFSSVGLDIYATDRIQDEPTRVLRRLAENNYAVIYITESLASTLQAEIDRYKESLIPAIIMIPGLSGNTGAGVAMVKKSVERAVGSDILFQNET